MAYLTREKIDVASLLDSVGDPALGGTVVFLGSVRSGEGDGPVSAIEYSAYDEMAEAELERIVAEVKERWPGTHLAVRHRVGSIPAGEASVAVVAASSHRAEAFDACRYSIEEIKKRLPIWKKELFPDGSASWRGNDGTRTAAIPPRRG